MTEGHYQRRQRLAAERLRANLNLRMPTTEHDIGCEGFFEPWDQLPVYGSYDSEFDALAFDVLANMIDRNAPRRTDLAADMFREMLCVADLCEYGTSPRVCFPTSTVREMLPEWLAKWRAVSAIVWAE